MVGVVPQPADLPGVMLPDPPPPLLPPTLVLPPEPVAFYASHGTHDSVLNYSNGLGLAQNFAKANGCTWATPTAVMSGAHVCTNEMGCMTGYPLEFCSFNGDHTPYPDGGNESSSWNAANVWTFFSQF